MTLGLGALAACSGPSASISKPRAAGTNVRFAHVEWTTASHAAVWAVWTDVRGWSRWDTGLRSARVRAPLSLGTRGRLIPKRGVPSRFEITAWVPEERYAFTTSLPGAALVVERSFVDDDDATAFKHEVHFVGPRAQRWSERLGPQFRVDLPEAMRRVAALAELG